MTIPGPVAVLYAIDAMPHPLRLRGCIALSNGSNVRAETYRGEVVCSPARFVAVHFAAVAQIAPGAADG